VSTMMWLGSALVCVVDWGRQRFSRMSITWSILVLKRLRLCDR
jgi:hypothetical protein